MAHIRPPVLPPRTAALAALLVVVLCLLGAFRAVLIGGRSLAALPGLTGLEPAPEGSIPPPVLDISSAYIDEPLGRLAAARLAAGELPLWNPCNGLGQPLLGNMQSALLSPFRWPLLCTGSPWVQDLALLARLLAAGALTLLLARALGLGPLAGALAGVAYGLTGYLVLHVNMHHLSVEALVPGLLWATVRLAQRATPARAVLLALFTWGAWVGGNPEATLFAALLAGGLLCPAARAAPGGWRAAGRVAFWALIGTLLAGPYLLPGLEHLVHGHHHHGGTTGSDAYRPWCAAGFLLPAYYQSAPQAFAGLRPPWFGAAVVALALLGSLPGPGSGAFPRRTLALLAGLLVLKALGAPGLQLLGRLPLLEMLLFHKYGLAAAALCLALLAGHGVQRLAGGAAARLALASGVLALCCLGLHLWNLRAGSGRPGFETFRPLLAPMLWPLGGLLAAALLCRRRAVPLALLAAGLAAAELFLAVPQERPLRRDPFRPPSYAQRLLAEIGSGVPVRSLSIGAWVVQPETQLPLFPGSRGRLSPNTGAALGIPDLRINDAIIVRRFARFAEALVDGRMQAGILEPGLFPPLTPALLEASEFFLRKWYFRQALAAAAEPGRDRAAAALLRGNAVLDALGVSHLILEEPEQARGRLARERPERWSAEVAEDGVTLYRNLGCPGRAFLPRRIEAVSGEDQALAWVAGHAERLLEAAAVEDAPEEWLGEQPHDPGDRVESRLGLGGELRLETVLAAPRVILISEAWYPGRRVRIKDGTLLPCRAGDLCFTAVRVPAGRLSLEVSIRPPSFRAGCLLAGLGAVLGLLALAAARGRGAGPKPPSAAEVIHG